MNWYADGLDYMGKHRDNERDLVDGATIVSVSYGETRTFRVRDMEGKILLDVPMQSGMLMAMCGRFQEELYHEVPRARRAGGRRINITLRRFKADT